MSDVPVLGLSGNIGGGKSTVAAMLAERGAATVSADALAREVVAPGSEGLKAVVARFGPEVLDADGALDRTRLGDVVFGDEAARRDLEAITHPRIQAAMAERMQQAIATAPPLVVVEVPLLFETGMHRMFSRTLLVTAPDEQRLQRILARDELSEDQARARMAAQMPQHQKADLATWTLVNDGDLAQLAARLDALWPRLVSPQNRDMIGTVTPSPDRSAAP